MPGMLEHKESRQSADHRAASQYSHQLPCKDGRTLRGSVHENCCAPGTKIWRLERGSRSHARCIMTCGMHASKVTGKVGLQA